MRGGNTSLLIDPPIDPIATDRSLHFDNLENVFSYLEYLTYNKNEEIPVNFSSEELRSCHTGKSIWLIEKYLNCSIPCSDLEFLFESQGISAFEAYLDPDLNFTQLICNSNTNEEVFSEIFRLNISGDHFNPYIRYKSCLSSASRTCSKLMDLAGLEIPNIEELDPHKNIFLDIVCTFPKIVDYYLINPDCRSRSSHKTSKNGKNTSQLEVKPLNFIDRMNICRKRFFEEIDRLFTYNDPNQFLGCNSSLHIWGSEVPVLPNCHVHNIIPFFSYDKKPKRFPILESIQVNDPDLLKCVQILEYNSCRSKSFEADSGGGEKISHSKTSISFGDKKYKSSFIVDKDKYKLLRLRISSSLRESLNFTPCTWYTSTKPVDIDKLRELWSDIVYNEFQDIMDNWVLLNIYVNFIDHYEKSKLLHKLQYKIRPPVLDLDLFFKKCLNVVNGHNSINTGKVLDYLNYKLTVAIKCSNTPDIERYESLLSKAEEIFSNYSDQAILDWLRFLSVWVTDTRVYGFWRNIKRYLLDPEHEILIEEVICPLCNSSIFSSNTKVRSCIVDHIVIRNRSKFLIYNVKGPPVGVS